MFHSLGPGDAYMRRRTGSPMVQLMACRLFGAKPLPEPMIIYLFFLVRTAFNKQAPAYVNGVKTHGKTGFGADESREAEVKTAL